MALLEILSPELEGLGTTADGIGAGEGPRGGEGGSGDAKRSGDVAGVRRVARSWLTDGAYGGGVGMRCSDWNGGPLKGGINEEGYREVTTLVWEEDEAGV